MIGLLVLAELYPNVVYTEKELFVLEMQPVYTYKFKDLEDYRVIQVTFNNLVKDAFKDQFVSHPFKVYPIDINATKNFVFLAFPADTVIDQIQYLGASLSQVERDVKAEPFNLLMYYRLKNDQLDVWELQQFTDTNNYRLSLYLAPLAYSKKLSWIARSKGIDELVNKYFNHVSPFYGGIGELQAMFGVHQPSYGENLMGGGSTHLPPLGAYTAWRNSPPHNENMKDAWSHIGTGCFITQRGTQWIQEFINMPEALNDSFEFGEDLVLEEPYDFDFSPNLPVDVLRSSIQTSTSVNSGSVIGASIGAIIICAVIGSVVAMIVKKQRAGTIV